MIELSQVEMAVLLGWIVLSIIHGWLDKDPAVNKDATKKGRRF